MLETAATTVQRLLLVLVLLSPAASGILPTTVEPLGVALSVLYVG